MTNPEEAGWDETQALVDLYKQVANGIINRELVIESDEIEKIFETDDPDKFGGVLSNVVEWLLKHEIDPDDFLGLPTDLED